MSVVHKISEIYRAPIANIFGDEYRGKAYSMQAEYVKYLSREGFNRIEIAKITGRSAGWVARRLASKHPVKLQDNHNLDEAYAEITRLRKEVMRLKAKSQSLSGGADNGEIKA